MKKKSRKRNPSIKKKSRKRNPSIKKKSRKRNPSIKKKSRKRNPSKSRKRNPSIKKKHNSIVYDGTKRKYGDGVEESKTESKESESKKSKTESKESESKKSKTENNKELKPKKPTWVDRLPEELLHKALEYQLSDCNYNIEFLTELLRNFGINREYNPRTINNKLETLNSILNRYKDEILKTLLLSASLKDLLNIEVVTIEHLIKILILLSFNDDTSIASQRITIDTLRNVFEISKNSNNVYEYGRKSYCVFEDIPLLNPTIQIANLVILNYKKIDTLKTQVYSSETNRVNYRFYNNMNCKNLSFYGFSCIRTIEDYFLHIASMGDDYTSSESESESDIDSTILKIDFSNFRNLERVGDNWMFYCYSLQSVDFRGLNKLHSVGKNWLYDCQSLKSYFFSNLNILENVGSGWMAFCNELVSPNFTQLNRLKRVGNDWMAGCTKLVSPNFIGLNSLENVGSGWMIDCLRINSNSYIVNDRFNALRQEDGSFILNPL
jgi:hypothetical protein